MSPDLSPAFRNRATPGFARGRGQVLLYLDYDGVLHHEDVWRKPKKAPHINATGNFKLFDHAPLLDELLTPYPEIGIVLSTSWVRDRGFHKARRRLPKGLKSRVVGSTFHSFMDPFEFKMISRGEQIGSDALRRKPADWFALDDDDDRWPAWSRDKLIRTHDELGITGPGVVSAIERMLEKISAPRPQSGPNKTRQSP